MALDYNLENLTPEEIEKLSRDERERLSLHNIAENTRKTAEGNVSQTTANRDDARDRAVSAQIGLQKAWGETAFMGVGLAAGLGGKRVQETLKPILDGLKGAFGMYMGIKEQQRSLEVAEKQVRVASEKLISMGINPETKEPISPQERRAHSTSKASPSGM